MPPAVASRRYTTAIFPATPSDKRALDLADRAPTALPSTLLACCPCGESLKSISTQHDVVERGLTIERDDAVDTAVARASDTLQICAAGAVAHGVEQVEHQLFEEL